jgi:hypothetical protein
MGRLRLGAVVGACAASAASMAVFSCAEPAAKYPDPARVAPKHDALLGEPFDVAAMAAQVAAFRGLTVRGPVAFTVVDDGATRHHVVTYDERPPPAGAEALWRALGVAAPGEASSAAVPALFAGGLTALEREKLGDIWARHPGETNDGERTWALVHAIDHVLEDQDGRLPAAGQGPDDDPALARRALFEGDAELTTAAFIASRRPAGDHWLAQLVADGVSRPAPAGAFEALPPFARRQWLFPYVDGFELVARAYRVGCFPLVNRMLEHPPASTEQVLDPQKYLAGEMPIRVEPPRAPDGYSAVVSTTMGELRIRAWLAQCPGARVLGPEALGWGGDALLVASDGLGRLASMWSTVWDDPSSAERFEAVLRSHPRCAGSADTSLSESPVVLREGDRVAYVSGLGGAAGSAKARELLAVPVVRVAPAPPLGDVQLRPIVDPRSFLGRGERVGMEYVSRPLGLTLRTAGFEVYASSPSEELTLEEAFGISTLELTVSALLTAWSPDLERRIARDVVGGFVGGGYPIDYLGATPITVDAGPGEALRWFGREGTNEILVFVPACGGKITLLAHGKGEGYGLWKEMKRALHGMRFDPAAPACKFVGEDTPPGPAAATPP